VIRQPDVLTEFEGDGVAGRCEGLLEAGRLEQLKLSLLLKSAKLHPD